MTGRPVLILGARSDIAMATARRFAQAGHPLQLAARDPAALRSEAERLAAETGVTVTCHAYDALATEALEPFIDSLPDLPEVAVCAVGTMNDQATNRADLAAATRDIRSNFEGPALTLGVVANRFEARGSGTLVGISSVAGDRGRASNYVYGAAKAGFTAFLSGLRNRLAGKGVHVVTVKPGFVATKMTEGMDLPARLTAAPGQVADAIFAAVETRRNVVYTKPVWRWIMALIRALPEAVFKKTDL
ncbi:SDR family oxidoreductase [Psychromarinibacter sp. C21-152]|uniref:SDR family oxidoreductase n=1 Tax=Psychromarinibacter sediminicola TaxID=3033385 RepID=A0AAE3T781_9RHOB|nr:SDR family oxidoreductase [Psychromarinibacter sediminicola]MDF0599363.1 SDR family oxidoreductase [Psychromarinibacter sediminicola]